MNLNPRLAHILLEIGQVASIATFASSLPGVTLIPNVGPILGGVAAAASAYLTWLKAQNIGNIPPKSS